MDLWQRLQSNAQSGLHRTGIPRKVLKRLFGPQGLGVGSTVLDAGCGRGELASYLERLGCDVAGFDESAERIAAARRSAPAVEFSCVPATAVSFSAHRFDFVLVRGLSSYAGSMWSSTALQTTARLLSCLRPGGRLVFLERRESSAEDAAAGHADECFAQHLNCFPGAVALVEIPDSIMPSTAWSSWRSFSSRHKRSGFLAASIDIPEKFLRRDEWQSIAASAAETAHDDCCDWSRAASRPSVRRAAA